MIALLLSLSIALAGYPHQSDLVITDGEARVAVISCTHTGKDLLTPWLQGGTPRESLRLALEAAVLASADAIMLIGDIGGAECLKGYDPVTQEVEYGCVATTYDPEEHALPREGEGAEVARQIELAGVDGTRLYYTAGNHDGAGEPGWGGMSWWADHVADPLTRRGVKAAAPGSSPDAYYARMRLECDPGEDQVVDWLMLADRNTAADYSVCGRQLDHLTRVSKGMPAGAYSLQQIDYLASRLVRGAELGYPLVVGAHHVPPETTFGSWEGEAREPVDCKGYALHGHHPSLADVGRPLIGWPGIIDGLTPTDRCDDWGGTAPFVGDHPVPRPSWLRELIGQVEAETGLPHPLRLWVGGHSHLPTPVHTQNGHGMDALLYPDGGGTPVQIVQAGGATRWHGDMGAAQFVLVSWDCSGAYEVERWAIEPGWAPPSCGTGFEPPTGYPGEYNVPRIQGSW